MVFQCRYLPGPGDFNSPEYKFLRLASFVASQFLYSSDLVEIITHEKSVTKPAAFAFPRK